MLQIAYPKLWRIASFAGMAIVLIGTLIPPDWLWSNEPGNLLSVSDKWLHGITFAVLTLWFSGQYAPSAYWRIVLGLLAFGLLIEICQRATSYRSAEMADMLANALGITAGMLVAITGAGGWSPSFENWLLKRFG